MALDSDCLHADMFSKYVLEFGFRVSSGGHVFGQSIRIWLKSVCWWT